MTVSLTVSAYLYNLTGIFGLRPEHSTRAVCPWTAFAFPPSARKLKASPDASKAVTQAKLELCRRIPHCHASIHITRGETGYTHYLICHPRPEPPLNPHPPEIEAADLLEREESLPVVRVVLPLLVLQLLNPNLRLQRELTLRPRRRRFFRCLLGCRCLSHCHFRSECSDIDARAAAAARSGQRPTLAVNAHDACSHQSQADTDRDASEEASVGTGVGIGFGIRGSGGDVTSGG